MERKGIKCSNQEKSGEESNVKMDFYCFQETKLNKEVESNC